MKAGKINPVSLERLFRHFKLEQTTEQPLNPDEFSEESAQCMKKLIAAINLTPSIPLDAALLPPLL